MGDCRRSFGFGSVLVLGVIALVLVPAPVAWTGVFVGTGTGAIPDGGPGCATPGATNLDVSFAVTGIPGTVTDVSVLIDTTHTWVGDVSATLIAPNGASHILFANTGHTNATSACGDSSNLDGEYEFTDRATGTNWWTEAGNTAGGDTLTEGDYRTTEAGGTTQTNNPAPETVMDSVFAAVPSNMVNGTWTLRFNDDGAGDTGSVAAASLALNEVCAELTLENDTLMVADVQEACGTIFLGPNYAVMGPNGFLIVRSGTGLEFRDGFEVGVDGRLEAGIDPLLNPLVEGLEQSRAQGLAARLLTPEPAEPPSPRAQEKLLEMEARSKDPGS